MASIVRADIKDSGLLTNLGKTTFIESHGHSASKEVIDKYVGEKFNFDRLEEELIDTKYIYHIIYHEKCPAGYSKIVLDSAHPAITKRNVTKLERLYLLKEFFRLKMGLELLQFNIQLSKDAGQAGMWLYVWKENPRAEHFYLQHGFKIIGSFNFKLTESHSNPNHHMFLEYS
jgi:GNAT superfamily N-acetyltransferase